MQLDELLEFLNLSDKDGLYSRDDLSSYKRNFLPNRLVESFKQIDPDYIFCINNEPLILFFSSKRDLELLEKQVWNFNQSPAIFIHDGKQWVVKNGFNLLDNKKELETIASENSNNLSDFEYFKIITGSSWEKYQEKFKQSNRVDFYLLNNIDNLRNNLKKDLPAQVANFLIGRVIFIRYLIDRKVELNKYGITDKEDFYNILDDKDKAYDFFKQVKEDFNGNLFPLSYRIDNIEIFEKDKVTISHLSKIKDLLLGHVIYNDGALQSSLFDIYDFSIIPIEFISNVYEKFIGIEKQADSGAYYTPLFLVDYIQKETVVNYFEKNPDVYNCKVLDPACGSGIFLVETLRQVIFQYQKNNSSYLNEENYEAYKDTLKQLLKDNIFGVDKDENAVSVAIFSLYITLLDNLRPKSIVGFRFPELIGTNFFVSDFFDTEKKFDSELKKHHFKFILGNPPWATKHPKAKQPFERYIENKKSENVNLEIENREIAEAFLVRVGDFVFDETAFVVVSKVLYKISRKKDKRGIFRKYLLNNFKIRQILELSSVRHLVFGADIKKNNEDKGTAPATILFYSKANLNEINNNIVKHISIKPNIFFKTFKLLVIEKYDIKDVAQKHFLVDDWLWKTLVYGNVLDYFFIKRLKENQTIYDCISNKEHFLFGKGVSVGGGDENSIDEHKTIKYSVNSKQKDLKPFMVIYTNNFLLDLEFVHRPRKIDLFRSPILLVGKGVSNDYKLKSAISFKDVIYTDAVTGIKPLTDQAIDVMFLLETLFNSALFSYFLVNTNSSIGIEREQSHDKEDKFSIPLPLIQDINTLKSNVVELKELYKLIDQEEFQTGNKLELVQKAKNIYNHLDLILLEYYGISKQENSLIDYTNNITIPLLKGSLLEKNKVIAKIPYESEYLTAYAQIFVDHFGRRFNSDVRFFEVEIVHSEHTILMKFKIILNSLQRSSTIYWTNQGDRELLCTISKFGFEQLSTDLFLQKDIKGVEDDFFYIAKPNQYKSWHSALAYLDLSEFVEVFHSYNSNQP
ncbi:MAG: hypothetical protein BGP15_07495 [Sphingobacterium sp. 40-24]|uniref:Eco57I restriction-modification methylase domain-containing protein n=1 Tax=Sphingobacterium TaxID=28453 RepID=UPI00095CC103|nr:N-6 DNA methylase [Sphingobacterium sp. 40-24]OJY99220.1 MAG: hypothetical protein BGP15_07495 [Sphingobacterium sp. 40-24]